MVTMPLPRVDLGSQCPQQRGLAGVHRPGDDDVLAGPHGRGEQGAEALVHRPHGAEVVEREVGEPVAPDGDGRSGRDRHEGGEPCAARQLEIELGSCRVEPALGQTEPPGGRPEEVHQLLVGVGHRGPCSRFVPSANVAQTRSQPLMSMFSISVSSTSAWRRPRPKRASRTVWAKLLLLGGGQVRRTDVRRPDAGERVQVEEGALAGEFLAGRHP